MPGAPLPPSLHLPTAVTDLSAVRSGDQVALTWTMPQKTTDKVLLQGPITTRICRNESSTTSCTSVSTLQLTPGSDATFTDSLPSPLSGGSPHELTYFVELVNRKGRSAGLSNNAEILAGGAPPAIEGLTAEVRKEGVMLHWLEAPQQSEPAAIRLQRKLLTAPAKSAGNGPLAAPAEPIQRTLVVAAGLHGDRALDSDIHFGEAYEYRAQRVTQLSLNGQTLELASPLSAPIRIEAADIFPPAVPRGLAAVTTLGENNHSPAIDLSWLPGSEAELAGYIVYRREYVAGAAENAWQRISPAQPVVGPEFHDGNVQPGHTYSYSVTTIGQNGHESAHSAEAQETVPEP